MALFAIKDLNFTYPKQNQPSLVNLNFEIEQGDFVAICGKSGCGKSTLIKHFKPEITPHGTRQGEILYQGQLLEKLDLRHQAMEIAYVSQNPDNQIVTDKVWHELAFGLENLGLDLAAMQTRVVEMASYFGIQNWFYQDVKELSGGQKQLLNLASAMVLNPEVLILDEPTSQLDPLAATDFLQTLKKLNNDFGITIIIVEHRLEEVFSLADKILVLEQGKMIAYDSPRQIGTNLKDNDMFIAFPASVQMYAKFNQLGNCPLTVNEGRKWLNEYCQNHQMTVNYQERPPLTNDYIIEAKDLWFRYERNSPDIIKGLNLKIKQGELYCVLGGNGTGKSTMLSLLSALNKPYRGKIIINKQNIKKYHGNQLFQGTLAFLPQDPQCLFVKDTVKEDLLEIFTNKKITKLQQEQLEKIIIQTQIEHLLNMHPYDLSGGEQQRVALAKVLLLNPQIILLDEPTKGLDGFYKQTLAKILETLKKNGQSILMVSHDLEFCAKYGDTCALFFDGKIITENSAKQFFSGNNFYTTAINRITRHLFADAIILEDLEEL